MKEETFAVTFEGDSKRQGLFSLGGWTWCHFRTSWTRGEWRTALSGDKGFPDYIATREGECVFIEIKGDGGKVSVDQQKWIDLLRGAGQRVYVFLPKDFEEAKEVLL